MTRIYDDPAQFTEDALAGFAALHARYVLQVPGGVVRSTGRPGKVAVVVGGGSGHYPAFCGVVGPGFADGAVVGNIFTSPSAADAASVARAAHAGSGVLLMTGNYAGDVMNFTLAVDALRADGIDARFLVVTDDVASASRAETGRRRGIAGDFTVFKLASAAAEQGYDLDDVERIARLANDRTRSLGVAFGGCTLPGAAAPMFSVPDGRMAMGLGIHGEPGISEEPLPAASQLAARLVDGILAERPAGAGGRVAVLLNGLGTTKYEELFVLWAHVARLLGDTGLELVDPEVGELVTSLDMAGCSLTVTWLDKELDQLWRAPADSPAYRKGPQQDAGPLRRHIRTTSQSTAVTTAAHARAARHDSCADSAVAAIAAMAAAMDRECEALGRLDTVAGDGDHGRGMARGTHAALAAAQTARQDGADAGGILVAAGTAWSDSAGGTSGVLWGAALRALGTRLASAGPVTPDLMARGVTDAYEAIMLLGKAAPGDKTMLDALGPFADELRQAAASGRTLTSAWSAAVSKAQAAAQATAELRPKVGRARPLADRSVGSPDPGAVSLAACVAAVAEILNPPAA